jgi:CheY-specific phosphatase CheX
MSENALQVDPTLLDVVIRGTVLGLEMSGDQPVPVGASRLAVHRHAVSVLVGLVGANSGTLSLNLSERALFHIAGGLLGDPPSALTEDGIDAIMEVGNIIAGAVKDLLIHTEYRVDEISLPSIILGPSYSVLYARGIHTVSVEFELPRIPVSAMNDRYFTVGISLLRGAGRRRAGAASAG